jgi:hypothetical protein
MAMSFVLTNSFLVAKNVLTIMLMLKLDGAACIEGQGTYMKCVGFPWLPVVAALSISKRNTATELIYTN